jgi:hypothetical protein
LGGISLHEIVKEAILPARPQNLVNGLKGDRLIKTFAKRRIAQSPQLCAPCDRQEVQVIKPACCLAKLALESVPESAFG